MRLIAAAGIAAASLALAGCPNPNAIGVQVYGSIKAVVTDASSGQAVSGAVVSAGSTYTCSTGSDGTCTLANIPVGHWTVLGNAPGLHGSADVTVTENNQATANIGLSP